MGEKSIVTFALQLSSVPSSNTDSEEVFIGKSLQTDTLSALIGCHFNKITDCCKKVNFVESLITKAKTCTHERVIIKITTESRIKDY